MTESGLTALLGFHNKGLSSDYSGLFRDVGYHVDAVESVEEMLKMVNLSEYTIYLMDINLGKPGSADISPAIKVYEAVKGQVQSQRAKFLAISANPEAVKSAQEQKIPALYKSLHEIMEFLGMAQR